MKQSPLRSVWQPHTDAYHCPDLFDDGFIALLIVTASQNRQAYLYETPTELFLVPGLLFHALAGAKMQKHLGLETIQPLKSRWVE